MRKITLSNGETVEVECLSFALTSGVVEPDGGVVIETEHFYAHQDVAYPIIFILGWFQDMNGCIFGRSVESVRPVLLHAKNEMNDKENVEEVMEAINILTEELNK
ncbi:hypothetical protein ACIQXU_09455 [Peribacillus sp. NPDC097284]|uniref:hypothetical protein n=1 Tax=Peribacillus sp. NPDC097284 TaxID=3364401 RepID=UPI00381DF326